MDKPKIAILMDLASLRISCEGFEKLAKQIKENFNIVSVKFYSYVAKRNRDFNEYIAAKGYDAVTPIASRRRNRLDTRQIIDGTIIGMTSTVDAVGFTVGQGDILPIVSFLKQKGKDVYDINVAEGDYTEEFTGFIKVDDDCLREGYAAPARKKAAAKKKVAAKKKPAPSKPAAQAEPDAPQSKYAEDVRKILSGVDILSRYK